MLSIGTNFDDLDRPSGSHTILVVSHQTLMEILRGRPPNGGAECIAEVWKYRYFRPITRFISETIQDRAIDTAGWCRATLHFVSKKTPPTLTSCI